MSNANTQPVQLDYGFPRAGEQVKEINLVKPNTGHCRGLSLKDVLSFEVNALTVLLPRITVPAMTAQDVLALELMDTLKIAEAITNFLAPTEPSPAVLTK